MKATIIQFAKHFEPWSLLRKFGVQLLVVLALILSRQIWLTAIGAWLAMPPDPHLSNADTIVIHGGNQSRSAYGITLFRQGLAPELWHTGYAKGEARVTSLVVRPGAVPLDSFHYLITTSTWSDGTAIAAAIRARKLHHVIVVTDWWHSRRALCSTEQQLQGYDVAISFEPSPSPAGPSDWWRNPEIRADVGSELVKMVYYALRYGWHPWSC